MRLLLSILFSGLLILLLSFVLIPQNANKGKQKHKKGYKNSSKETILPAGYNDLFAGSGECSLCHDNLVNSQDESVSIINDWRSSMMANASKDPFWRAKVSHETLVNPDHAEVLEDVCTRCHAPVGHYNAHHNGLTYSIEDMVADSLAMDGVSCTVCHQITNESMGNFSGNMEIGLNHIIWGQYEDPLTMPMYNHTGYTPEYGEQIKDSRLCGSCHTLLTNSVDLDGELTGTEFVEQAIYQEWSNSDYPEMGVSCQSCHVPDISDSVVISSAPPWFDSKRSPFGKHHLVGANVFMLKLMKENSEDIGLSADDTRMDSTIARATRMLQENSLILEFEEVDRTSDTLFVELSLQNIAGHKFPSGYPSRRVYIEVIAFSETNDTIFHSGKLDDEFNLVGEDESFEPHYDVIRNEEEVQIYEMVMGNISLEPTTVLERAYTHLKDNRIPPIGFSTQHYSYDTTKIVGQAEMDLNFNFEQNQEGSGKDLLYYHIPINGETGILNVKAIAHYQSVTNKWLENMFTYTSEEIETFESYYNSADKTPVVVFEASLLSVITGSDNRVEREMIEFYPNPVRDYIHIANVYVGEVMFYNMQGKIEFSVIATDNENRSSFVKVRVPEKTGVYVVQVVSVAGDNYFERIIVN